MNRIRNCFEELSMTPQRKADVKDRILAANGSTAEHAQPVRRRQWTRRLTAAVLAAVMLCSVGMAAYYGLADKFELFAFAKKPLDPDMQSIMEQYGASIDRSVVIDGVTVTAEAYLTDKMNLHLLYSMEFTDPAQASTVEALLSGMQVFVTDKNGNDLGAIVGGSSTRGINTTPGKYYYTRSCTLADDMQIPDGSQITLRFTSDQYEKTAFDLNAYLDQYGVQKIDWKDASFNPVSFTHNDVTYTVQALVSSGNDLSLCYTIDRTETIPLSDAKLMLYNDGGFASRELLGGLTAFERYGQHVYVRGFALAPNELADDAALYITPQYDLSFAYTPNNAATTYLADVDFDGDAVSQAISVPLMAEYYEMRGDADADPLFAVEAVDVTPISITLSGTCEVLSHVSVGSTGYGSADEYWGMRFLLPDGTSIPIANSTRDLSKEGIFVCSFMIADPIDPETPVTIEIVETGERFTFG